VNLLSSDIPFIRSKTVELLRQKSPTQDVANKAIDTLTAFYQKTYPQAVSGKLDATVTEVKNLYSETSFPENKAFWDTNPNFERHIGLSGCFRCHDDRHVSQDSTGKVVGTISAQCNMCHSVPITSRGDEIGVNTPIIGGAKPATHNDFRWTIDHQSTTEMQKAECYQCHGEKSCNNSICHGVTHPADMLYSHPTQYQKSGELACFMCHQDVLCSRCHPSITTNGYTQVITSTVGTPYTNTIPSGGLNVQTNTITTTTAPRK
jgi:hypothetical protein